MEPEIPTENKKPKKRAWLNIIVILLIALAVISSTATLAYILIKKPEVLGLQKITNQEEKDELPEILSKVSKLMILPEETPVLATVSDLESVKSQDFFKNAKLGDKVLVFKQAKKAILYRPSDDIIVEVGAVNDDEDQNSESGSVQESDVFSDEESPEDVFLQITPQPISPAPTIITTPTSTPSAKITP